MSKLIQWHFKPQKGLLSRPCQFTQRPLSLECAAVTRRQHLSLELSLGIVFFTNIVLSLAALVYTVTGINTDIFVWAKDYLAALKEDDSAVNTKVPSCNLMLELLCVHLLYWHQLLSSV